MKIERNNNSYWLTPGEGYTYITDGNTITDLAIVGSIEASRNWHDTNEEPPIDESEEEITAEEILNELEKIL